MEKHRPYLMSVRARGGGGGGADGRTDGLWPTNDRRMYYTRRDDRSCMPDTWNMLPAGSARLHGTRAIRKEPSRLGSDRNAHYAYANTRRGRTIGAARIKPPRYYYARANVVRAPSRARTYSGGEDILMARAVAATGTPSHFLPSRGNGPP